MIFDAVVLFHPDGVEPELLTQDDLFERLAQGRHQGQMTGGERRHADNMHVVLDRLARGDVRPELRGDGGGPPVVVRIADKRLERRLLLRRVATLRPPSRSAGSSAGCARRWRSRR